MKLFYISSLLLLFSLGVQAQQTLNVSREEAEAIFLQNNLLLISEKLNIQSQQAEVIQARQWPNPTFSVSEINFWATPRQTGGQEVSPPFFGDFGRNQQVAFELEQLIQTAGKRKKLIALEQVDVTKAEQYFEDLLRGLKLELRNHITDLQYINKSIEVHQRLVDNLSVLINAYKNQLDNGTISKAEYIRLKAQELELKKEILDLTKEANEVQKELRLLLRVDAQTELKITDEGFVVDTKPYHTFTLSQQIELLIESRPDYKLALLEKIYNDKLLDYEKSQRVPDLNLGVNYDRNGNTMLDFIGVGLSFDLPVFNRNKGNIRKAQIGVRNAEIQRQHTLVTIENEIHLAYQSLHQAIDFVERIENDYEDELDSLLENYTKNFSSKNVSMLEYLDFIGTYLENKNIILNAFKDVNHKVEELRFAFGADL